MLDAHPQLRERLTAFGALSLIFIGGAGAVDFMLTGGLQFQASAAAAPTVSAPYINDTNENWRNAAPPVAQVSYASVQSAGADAGGGPQTLSADNLDGAPDGAVVQTAYPPELSPRDSQSAPAQSPPAAGSAPVAAEHAEATRTFEQIEAQIRQADPQQPAAPDTPPAAKF